MEYTTIKFWKRELNINKNTSFDFNDYMREVWVSLLKACVIGGENMEVEIEESCFSHRKFNVGSRLLTQWIFSSYCTQTRKFLNYLLSRITCGKAVKFIPTSGKLISSWQIWVLNLIQFATSTILLILRQAHTLKKLKKLNAAPTAACLIHIYANLCGVDANRIKTCLTISLINCSGRFTLHSLRATVATRLHLNHFDEIHVWVKFSKFAYILFTLFKNSFQVTGHISDVIQIHISGHATERMSCNFCFFYWFCGIKLQDWKDKVSMKRN